MYLTVLMNYRNLNSQEKVNQIVSESKISDTVKHELSAQLSYVIKEWVFVRNQVETTSSVTVCELYTVLVTIDSLSYKAVDGNALCQYFVL